MDNYQEVYIFFKGDLRCSFYPLFMDKCFFCFLILSTSFSFCAQKETKSLGAQCPETPAQGQAPKNPRSLLLIVYIFHDTKKIKNGTPLSSPWLRRLLWVTIEWFNRKVIWYYLFFNIVNILFFLWPKRNKKSRGAMPRNPCSGASP